MLRITLSYDNAKGFWKLIIRYSDGVEMRSPIHSHTTSYKKLLASKSRQGVFVLYCRIWVSEEFKKGLKVRAGLDDIDLILV